MRRKFVECETSYPEQSKQALDLIRELYRIERACEGSDEEALGRRRVERRARSQAIVDELFKWAGDQVVLKQSGIGRAIFYMIGQRAGMEVFLNDARVPLDNNLAERSLRGVVVGRKNHYGSRSERGTQVAAIFYTLIESAKLAGVEPKRYLLTAIENALRNPGTITLPRDLIDVGESTDNSG